MLLARACVRGLSVANSMCVPSLFWEFWRFREASIRFRRPVRRKQQRLPRRGYLLNELF